MTPHISRSARRRSVPRWIAGALTPLLAAAVVAMTSTQAVAATAVPLGTADSFAVLAGQSVTNTGPSVITGDLGVSPGTAISGFPPGLVNGVQHSADAVAPRPRPTWSRRTTTPPDRPRDATLPPDAGGLTLVPGVYTAPPPSDSPARSPWTPQGNPNAVWVFQVGSGLTTASASQVALINGASAVQRVLAGRQFCDARHQLRVRGHLMALTSITVTTTGASIDGRALAREGSVTLDTNRISRATCVDDHHGRHHDRTTAGTTTGTTPVCWWRPGRCPDRWNHGWHPGRNHQRRCPGRSAWRRADRRHHRWCPGRPYRGQHHRYHHRWYPGRRDRGQHHRRQHHRHHRTTGTTGGNGGNGGNRRQRRGRRQAAPRRPAR